MSDRFFFFERWELPGVRVSEVNGVKHRSSLPDAGEDAGKDSRHPLPRRDREQLARQLPFKYPLPIPHFPTPP